ncbi:MAG: hypothetical protein RR615_16595 [Morganella sp. (in: enterobacteria)]
MESGQQTHHLSDGKIIIEAGTEITLKVGDSFVRITPGAIFTSGNLNIGDSGPGAGAPVKLTLPDGVAPFESAYPVKKYCAVAAQHSGSMMVKPSGESVIKTPEHSDGVLPVQEITHAPAREVTAGRKKCFTLYRADGRNYEEMKTKYKEGFKAWVPLDTEQARKFIGIFTGSKDTAGLPGSLTENINKWGSAPKLGDLSAYIKYTKDQSTVWVSTAINTAAGGQNSGAPLYEISVELYESKIVRQNLIAAPEGRKKIWNFRY